MLSACRFYSFTGAAIEGKTVNIHFIENNARIIAPSLSPTFTQKLRQRILNQSSLAQIDKETTDYDIAGNFTNYDISVTAIAGNETHATNRLTISVNINFKNKLNPKGDFTQTFTRFGDFSASQNLQSVESKLINDISELLADDIFNKCFVNW
jgi:Lipopolysaccharide-assembly